MRVGILSPLATVSTVGGRAPFRSGGFCELSLLCARFSKPTRGICLNAKGLHREIPATVLSGIEFRRALEWRARSVIDPRLEGAVRTSVGVCGMAKSLR